MTQRKKLTANTIIPPELYVRRKADRQLSDSIINMGRPPYILVARQMGKTNLLIHAMRQMGNEHLLFVYVDLSNKLPSSRDCFRNIIDTLLGTHPAKLAAVKHRINLMRSMTQLAPNKEFEAEVLTVLELISAKIVFIIDEIDALIDTDYSDEIFAQIRSVYFTRINFPPLERITFVLSGVAEPATIIKDRKKSPFNIGEKIYLDDFDTQEYNQFLVQAGLSLSPDTQNRIFDWVSGHPRMTWEVCSAIEDLILAGRQPLPSDVDEVVKSLYLDRFDRPPVDHIRDLVRSDKSILRALKQIIHCPDIPIADNVKKSLYLAGITQSDSLTMSVSIKNRVISESLNDQWLNSIESFGIALVHMASEQKRLHNYDIAIKQFTEYLQKEDVSDAKLKQAILLDIGECHQYLEHWDKAIEYLSQCKYEEPTNPQEFYRAQLNLGYCYLACNDLQRASDVFTYLISHCKRGPLKWKACVNQAAVVIRRDDVNGASVAEGLYVDLLRETDDFDDADTNDLRVMSLHNLASIKSDAGDKETAKELLYRAVAVCSKQLTPFLSLQLADLLDNATDRINVLRSAINCIVDGRLDLKVDRVQTVLHANMSFDAVTLRAILFAIFEEGDFEYYNKLSSYCLTHFMDSMKSPIALAVWLAMSRSDKQGSDRSIQVLEYSLREGVSERNEDIIAAMDAYRILALNKREAKKPFICDLESYVSLIDTHANCGRPIGEHDLIAFVIATAYLRDQKSYSKGISLARVITKLFDSAPTDVRSEFSAIYFLLAQIHELLRQKTDAVEMVQNALSLLNERDPHKTTSVMAAQQIDLIKKEARAILDRCTIKQPIVRSDGKIGRNDPCPCGSGKKYKYCCVNKG